MSNWRKLPAGRELDRVIAERLGYHAEKVTWTPESAADTGWMWAVCAPDGKRAAFGSSKSIDDAWNTLMAWQRIGEFSIALYSTDANAALTLFPWHDEMTMSLEWGYFRYPDHAKYAFHVTSKMRKGITEHADTAPLAICRAWLAWKDESA